jgi:hypothetical protein
VSQDVSRRRSVPSGLTTNTAPPPVRDSDPVLPGSPWCGCRTRVKAMRWPFGENASVFWPCVLPGLIWESWWMYGFVGDEFVPQYLLPAPTNAQVDPGRA